MACDDSSGRLTIHYCNEKFFVWNIKDVARLRKDYRIIGTFIGSLPSSSYQNTHLGLPLQLLKEEVKILLDENAVDIYLLDASASTANSATDYANNQEIVFAEFKKLLHHESVQEIERKLDQIVEGRRKRLRRSEDQCIDRKTALEQEIQRLPEITKDLFPIQLFSECPWSGVYTNFDVNEWNYPSSPEDQLRYLSFRDMWSRGYYLTSGLKFGCDFLVYEGDPSMCHAKYMLICNSCEDDVLRMQLFVFGRLSSQVNKEVLIASLGKNDSSGGGGGGGGDGKNAKIAYVAFKWETSIKKMKTS